MHNRRSADVTAATILTFAIVMSGMTPLAATADSTESPDAITVDAHTSTVTDDANEVSIRLPGDEASSAVETETLPDTLFSQQGDPLLSTTVGGSVISTFATNERVQTLIEIPDASAPSSYSFSLTIPDGGSTEMTADGGVLVKGSDGMPVGGFKAPWAIDALGNPVHTQFDIRGDVLVQSVSFTLETAFPVVADPDWGTEWWGRWMRLTKKETKNLAAASGDIQSWIGILSAVCAAAPPIAGACAAIINISALVHGQIVRDAAKKGRCIAINVPFTSVPPPHMTVVNCTR